MDPFLSHENLDAVSMFTQTPKNAFVHKAHEFAMKYPMSSRVSPKERIDRLNQMLVDTVCVNDYRMDNVETSIISPPKKSYRLDERIIVINAQDDGSTNTNVYDFRVRFTRDVSSTSASGLSVRDVIKNCISITPIAIYVPSTDVVANDTAFLVLQTDALSSNTMQSTQGLLDGNNVIMSPASSPADPVVNFVRFTNLTNTSLRSTDPQNRLSSLHMRVLQPNGSDYVSSSTSKPHLVLKIMMRVPV